MDSKKRDQVRNNLTSMQAILYTRDFKKADKAGGFTEKKGRR